MPLCTDCRNGAFIVGGQDDVYSRELTRPCSRCGWVPETCWVWEIDLAYDGGWSDEEIQRFVDGLKMSDLPDLRDTFDKENNQK